MADSDSEVGGIGSEAGTDFADDGEPGFDPSQLEKMTEKQRKKWDKNIQKWRVFMDFLVRHIAITTFRYNCFEQEDLPDFMKAMEKADSVRATVKLKKGEEKHITCFKAMRDTSDILIQHQHIVEANRLRKFLDIAGRMRGIAMIAGSFYKALKKGKVKGVEKVKYYLDFWKGFTVRSYDYAQLDFKGANPESFSELERKYKVWPTVVRTALNLSQKFIKKASDSCGLDIITDDPKVLQKHMQAVEYVVATKIEDMLYGKVLEETKSFMKGSHLLQPHSAPAGLSRGHDAATKSDHTTIVLDDIEPELMLPISDTGALMSLPAEPPKDKKKGKKKKGSKKSGRSHSASSHRPKSKKKKK